MIISTNHLKKIVDLPPQEKLVEILTSAGLNVEGIKDDVLDLEITPNRGDCLSILGVAREIGAKTGQKIKFAIPSVSTNPINKPLKLEISSQKLCPSYIYRLIDNVKIGPSPEWLVKKLKAFDFRPVNNIVDITNLVMLELGQPMHAFDYDKVLGQIMKVRPTQKGEKITTLDGKDHNLPEGAIIIEDKQRIIDLAGIMGGENSQVSQDTKTIILQAAVFDPITIRQTAKALNFQTDASYRYERGVDILIAKPSLDWAASTIGKILPDVKIGEIQSIALPYKKRIIEFSCDKINHLLGTKYSPLEINKALQQYGFEINKNQAEVPFWRLFDIYFWQDLAEEVGRFYGYNQIPKIQLAAQDKKALPKDYRLLQVLTDLMVENGFMELIGYPLVSAKQVDAKQALALSNSLSPETEYLRTDLLASLLQQMSRNPWAKNIAVFEIGHIFKSNSEEVQFLAIADNNDVLDKTIGVIKNLWKVENINIKVGKLDRNLLDLYKIKRGNLFCFILDQQILNQLTQKDIKWDLKTMQFNPYRPVSKFPPATFDISFVVKNNISQDSLQEVIEKVDDKIFIVELFDTFQSEKFGKDKKSVAYHIILQDLKKSLTDGEANQIMDKARQTLISQFQAQIRM